MGQNKKWYDFKFFLAFAAPTAFIFVTVMLIPFIYGLAMSFTDTNGISSTNQFVGLQNYIKVFQDKVFWTSMVVTLKYVLGCVVLTNLLAFIIAYLLTTGIRGQNFLRAAFFTPNLLGGIVLGLVWRFVFQNALVYVGTSLHIPIFEQSWLADPNKALVTLIIVTVWQLSGYMMIIYVAGFMGISRDVLEAADIDGCNYWQKIVKVEAPLMVPSFIICLFLTLSRCFMVYDVNISLTKGEPFGSTVLVSLNIYREAFNNQNYGTGQAEAFLLFLIIAAISLTQVYSGKKMEVEQ
ncbi:MULTISPECIES: carbohydrate ABC transporter permease [Caproicibacterium]|uniref:Sugar ABC transporter permease n=1 Tax=Caproicibacterium argilliputei TaxID=3030016 RepID=A0AA97DAP6_9FIRM|nr:sugar ABC transporter permease [Caproicibacterium argilliputei]WOC32497.1 sugar ABC transporter permease [Caproicibacterium argilliputei]